MKELYAAFAKAQGQFPSIPKNKSVTMRGSYSYNYADLDQIVEVVRPILAANGLALFQTVEGNICTSTLVHESGNSIFSFCPIHYQGNDMQKLGAAITYARRYGLSLLLGITTDDDLDANELQDEPREVKDRPVNAQKQEVQRVNNGTVTGAHYEYEKETAPLPPAKFTPSKYPLSDKQIKRFYAIAQDKKWPPMYADAYLKGTFAKSVKDLSRQEYETACEFLEKNTCNDVLKNQYQEFCVKRESAVDAMKRVQKTGQFVDHTVEPPFPPESWAPMQTDEIPF